MIFLLDIFLPTKDPIKNPTLPMYKRPYQDPENVAVKWIIKGTTPTGNFPAKCPVQVMNGKG